MPVGHERIIEFPDVRAKELRRACLDALDELRWDIFDRDDWWIVALVPRHLGSFGEALIIEIDDEELFIRSECRVRGQFIDWGQNRRNVQRFIDRVEDILGF